MPVQTRESNLVEIYQTNFAGAGPGERGSCMGADAATANDNDECRAKLL